MTNKSQKLLRQEMSKILNNLDHRWHDKASDRIVNNLVQILETELNAAEKNIPVLLWDSSYLADLCGGLPNLNKIIDFDNFNIYMHFGAQSKNDQGIEYLKCSRDGDNLVCGTEKFDPKNYESCVLVMPSLAIDSFGNRLGFGAYSYKLFLQNCKNIRFTLVGVCWSLQLIDSFQERPEDIVLDYVCTEESYTKSATSIL